MLKSHYEVLGLARSTASTLTDSDIKAAYKRALLLHHPDKKVAATARSDEDSAARQNYRIDDIANALKVLLDPQSRAEHDRELTLQARKKLVAEAGGHTGLETVDLDDLEPIPGRTGGEDGDAWSKSCRCGRSYTITEAMLEQEADKGELYIPCEGCSLCLKVLFQAAYES